MRWLPVLAGTLLLALGTAQADIIVTGSFGANGDVGFQNSPGVGITFGTGQGSIFQIDGFLRYGDPSAQSIDLATDPLTGLTFSFAATQPTANQLLLTYSFTNDTASTITGLQFLWFVDPDIGDDYANETAGVTGTTGGNGPSAFQIGDPVDSSIFTHLLQGGFNNANDFASSGGDVSTGLGFVHGDLGANETAQFQLLLSDDGPHTSGFSITQYDPVNTLDSLTISGGEAPEPATWFLVLGGVGILAARRRIRSVV